ncbi:MAG: hypothetical protein VKJ24_16870 [Synechococcales bacterium]|nr:hypothetical protein [Synechococcales bacterium]
MKWGMGAIGIEISINEMEIAEWARSKLQDGRDRNCRIGAIGIWQGC